MAAVRKRIVIGLLILSVIGTAVFFFSQPKKGTVEWHKKEYLAARNGQLTHHVREIWSNVTGQHMDRLAHARRIEMHETALIKVGYLEKRTFVVTNRPAGVVATTLWMWATRRKHIINTFGVGTNELIVVGVREEMAKWEEFIRKADVP